MHYGGPWYSSKAAGGPSSGYHAVARCRSHALLPWMCLPCYCHHRLCAAGVLAEVHAFAQARRLQPADRLGAVQ
eukprot:8886512-Pyramimonas_sp.AAC.1